MAAAVGAVALVGGGAATGSGATTASLRFVRIDPLIVAGRNFRSAERVTVTVHIGLRGRTVRVTANGDGAFRVRLGRIHNYDPCGAPLSVSARGSRGSTATVRARPLMCPDRQP